MGGDTRLPALSALHGPAHPIVRVVAAYSRALLSGWCASVKVRGLNHLVDVLQDEKRKQRGQGVLTYANHISVADEPTLFGSLPAHLFRRADTTRWTLGASDVMFTNRVFSRFFRHGQVLPTDRGRGVFQPALDRSIDIMEKGGWVHVFPEGYVNLSRTARVRRFKWGISRMLLEAGHNSGGDFPLVLPVWISGFDRIMPEPRSWPRWFPRPGANVTVTFGRPINDTLEPILKRMRQYATSNRHDASEKSPTSEELRAELDTTLIDTPTLASGYPIPSMDLFTKPAILASPPDGVPWPVSLPDSRSALAMAEGLDSDRARLARSFVAAELRAHLVKLGDSCGGTGQLAHRIMAEEEALSFEPKN